MPYFQGTKHGSDVIGLQMKAHKGRVLNAWRHTEFFNLRVPPRSGQTLNSTR